MHSQFTEKLNQLRKQEGLKILDIGGWFAPCALATDMVDLMPYATLNREASYGGGALRITPERYLQIDLGSVEKLPYKDKEFDFVICRHTLEDLKDPIRVCKEINRIGKAGYIETPHRVYESTKGVERHWWAGHYHHRWFVEVERNTITFQYKPHNLHSSSSFHWRLFPWQKMRDEFKNAALLWESSFEFEERLLFEYSDTKKNLREFKNRFEHQKIKQLRWSLKNSP
jgi:hypothetical protein